jgi:hypothetical protein
VAISAQQLQSLKLKVVALAPTSESENVDTIDGKVATDTTPNFAQNVNFAARQKFARITLEPPRGFTQQFRSDQQLFRKLFTVTDDARIQSKLDQKSLPLLNVFAEIADLPSQADAAAATQAAQPAAAQPTAKTASSAAATTAEVVHLNPGVVLVTRKLTDVIVETSLGNARCAKGATALFFDNGKNVVIYSLDAGAAADVAMNVGAKRVTIFPGREAAITRDTTDDFDTINPSSGIAYKAPQHREVDNFRVWDAQIDLVTGITAVPVLREMLISDDKGDQSIIRKFLRDACILGQM